MPAFQEEQLDSSVGYFAAQPGQLLLNGRWKIICKLGWGPRSSTWLAEDTAGTEERTSAIKIFTQQATTDSTGAKEMGILERSRDWGASFLFPMLQESFYEQSSWGQHLCLVLLPRAASLESMRLGNPQGGYLLLHIVKKVASDMLNIMYRLHEKKIVHGAISADNILLVPQFDWEKDVCRATNATIERQVVNGVAYPVVLSQPIPHGHKWNDSQEEIAEADMVLSNFRRARSVGRRAHISIDAPQNVLPPEAIQGQGMGTKADIWMFGCMIYLLLTGSPLFPSEKAVDLEDIDMALSEIEDRIVASKKLSDGDVPSTVAFLRACLTVDPKKRPTADDLCGHRWAQEGNICSCGYCSTDSPLPPQ